MYRRSLKKEIVSVLVDNQANVLTRVVSMFGRRGFNIDSLTVSATNDPTLSRITIVFNATERSMQQIIPDRKTRSGEVHLSAEPGKCTVP